jgi:hypothetical protein
MKISTLEGLLASFREANGDMEIKRAVISQTEDGPAGLDAESIDILTITRELETPDGDEFALLNFEDQKYYG